MARQRSTYVAGMEPMIRRRARDGVILGRSAADIASSIKTALPKANLNTIRRLVREEQGRQGRVDALLNADRRLQILNVGLFGCGPKTKELRIRVTVTINDPRTGARRQFGHTVQAGVGMTVEGMLNAVIAEVENEASQKGYGTLGVSYSSRTSTQPHYQIEYVDCI